MSPFPNRIYLPGDANGFVPTAPFTLLKESRLGGIAQPYVMEDVCNYLTKELSTAKAENQTIKAQLGKLLEKEFNSQGKHKKFYTFAAEKIDTLQAENKALKAKLDEAVGWIVHLEKHVNVEGGDEIKLERFLKSLTKGE